MELDAHIEAMRPLGAERMMDRAQAAAYPVYLQHESRHAQEWWRGLMADARNTVQSMARRATGRKGPLFLFMGVGVSFGELREKLGAAIGQRLSA